jgi:ABC-type antimicrobial peptide transport system permease subunit
MNRLESIWQALDALRGNKLRSLLTMLGVIIGVGAMVIMVAVVTGFQRTVQREFEGLGSRLIFTFYQPDERRARETFRARRRVDALRTADARAIREQCDLLASVSAERDLGEARAAHGAEEHTTRAVGVEPQYQQVRSVRVARGRFVEAADLEEWRTVCVLGTEIARKLFGEADPIGRDVRVNRTPLTVVGLLEYKPRSFDENYNDRIYIPLTTLLKRMAGNDILSVIFSQAHEVGDTAAAMDQIWGVLMRRHDDRPDFRVDSQARVVQTLNTILFALGGVLAGIAGLSLLVGGIGIMNIMLVSVTERTREIGIRKAVGAKRHDILWQFLIEAGTLSGFGGVLGLGLGYGGAAIIAAVAGERIPATVPPWAAAVGLVFAVAVGVVAGVYPAFRAARLDPIQALRHE